ncbi:YmaF family protein [Desulfosporosinus sp.]|uniref:YmaF family protein n=1 Tax=Desulfosporosinus sp. TaxID=157907 RepID=UPI0023197117|nr:YmaF family protein [Desulfosporosinus sp.]MCO5387396.1 YmaF family protein [Desulfosporosinus sp.]MDA8222866.1 YmaF family protein [Desulfitobacterium hafniense]
MYVHGKSDPAHNHGSVTHTSCDHGHSHQCLDVSGPSLPISNNFHVHDWDFYTSVDDGHRHHISGPDMPAPGV